MVLIADDSDPSRQRTKKFLATWFDVAEARNGRDVIDIVQSSERQVSCILLDLLMPVMDGYKVLEFMRDNGILEHIPVIVVTAVSDVTSQLAALDAGAVELIEKPWDEDILLNRVKHYISVFANLQETQNRTIRQSESRWAYYAAILDSLPQAVFVFENATLRVKYSNAAFSLFPGIPPAPSDKPLSELFPPAEYASILTAVSELLTTRIQRPLILEKGGQRFSIVFNAILDASGEVSDIVGTAVNVTHGCGTDDAAAGKA